MVVRLEPPKDAPKPDGSGNNIPKPRNPGENQKRDNAQGGTSGTGILNKNQQPAESVGLVAGGEQKAIDAFNNIQTSIGESVNVISATNPDDNAVKDVSGGNIHTSGTSNVPTDELYKQTSGRLDKSGVGKGGDTARRPRIGCTSVGYSGGRTSDYEAMLGEGVYLRLGDDDLFKFTDNTGSQDQWKLFNNNLPSGTDAGVFDEQDWSSLDNNINPVTPGRPTQPPEGPSDEGSGVQQGDTSGGDTSGASPGNEPSGTPTSPRSMVWSTANVNMPAMVTCWAPLSGVQLYSRLTNYGNSSTRFHEMFITNLSLPGFVPIFSIGLPTSGKMQVVKPDFVNKGTIVTSGISSFEYAQGSVIAGTYDVPIAVLICMKDGPEWQHQPWAMVRIGTYDYLFRRDEVFNDWLPPVWGKAVYEALPRDFWDELAKKIDREITLGRIKIAPGQKSYSFCEFIMMPCVGGPMKPGKVLGAMHFTRTISDTIKLAFLKANEFGEPYQDWENVYDAWHFASPVITRLGGNNPSVTVHKDGMGIITYNAVSVFGLWNDIMSPALVLDTWASATSVTINGDSRIVGLIHPGITLYRDVKLKEVTVGNRLYAVTLRYLKFVRSSQSWHVAMGVYGKIPSDINYLDLIGTPSQIEERLSPLVKFTTVMTNNMFPHIELNIGGQPLSNIGIGYINFKARSSISPNIIPANPKPNRYITVVSLPSVGVFLGGQVSDVGVNVDVVREINLNPNKIVAVFPNFHNISFSKYCDSAAMFVSSLYNGTMYSGCGFGFLFLGSSFSGSMSIPEELKETKQPVFVIVNGSPLPITESKIDFQLETSFSALDTGHKVRAGTVGSFGNVLLPSDKAIPSKVYTSTIHNTLGFSRGSGQPGHLEYVNFSSSPFSKERLRPKKVFTVNTNGLEDYPEGRKEKSDVSLPYSAESYRSVLNTGFISLFSTPHVSVTPNSITVGTQSSGIRVENGTTIPFDNKNVDFQNARFVLVSMPMFVIEKGLFVLDVPESTFDNKNKHIEEGYVERKNKNDPYVYLMGGDMRLRYVKFDRNGKKITKSSPMIAAYRNAKQNSVGLEHNNGYIPIFVFYSSSPVGYLPGLDTVSRGRYYVWRIGNYFLRPVVPLAYFEWIDNRMHPYIPVIAISNYIDRNT